MTQELFKEIDRNIKLLTQTEPNDQTYNTYLYNIKQTVEIIDSLTWLAKRTQTQKAEEPATAKLTIERDLTVEPYSVEAVKTDAEEHPVTEPFPPVAAPAPTEDITFNELRSRLAKARLEKKVDINAILQAHGCKGLSQLPKEEYAAVLAEAEA